MMNRAPLRRKVPLRKKRPGIRRGELTDIEKGVRREFIYNLSGGRCELGLPGCKGIPLPYNGSVFERWHLVHMRAKRRFGWPTEGAHRMHIEMMHQKGMRPE